MKYPHYSLFALLLLLLASQVSAYEQQSINITVNGKQRNMVVFTPNTLPEKSPLFIVTHGMNQDPEYQYGSDKLYELIDTAKFVVTYLRSDGSTWDIGGTNDQNFVSKTIDEMYTRYNIDKDRVYCGSPFPDFTYSINGSVTYKNFDLNITFQGVVGNKIYNATRLELEDVTRGTNYLNTVLDHWTESNHNAKTPRLVWTDPNRNARSESNRFLESGTYFRLRTLQLGYTLPKNLLGGYIKNCRFYIDMDNLFTITPYSGYSPDVNASNVYQRGFDEFIYPNNRTFMVGVNLSF